jgi:hypothetical protein
MMGSGRSVLAASIPAMRLAVRKLLSCSLLATYAGISFLGQGLHLLLPDDGHHHGFDVIVCANSHHPHDHDCCADGQHDSPAGPIIANACAADSHDCEICEFLFQAVSQPPQIATTPDLHPLVAEVPCHPQGFYSPTILGLHAPRGPPQLLG